MKLLIIGIDAVSPGFIRESLEELPYLNQLVQKGASAAYKGYVYGYGSRDNWISMYTGLSPEEHGVINHLYQKTGKFPLLSDYSTDEVFWKVLNQNGWRVGLWKLYGTMPPESIEGYIAAGDPGLEPSAQDSRVWSDVPRFTKDCAHLSEVLTGNPLQPPMPKGPAAYGYTLEELQENPELLKNIMTADYFEESLDYLEGQLAYHLTNITRVNEEEPVDVFWFYDAIYDFISHFVHHDPEKKVLLKALQIIDRFTEKLVEVLEPENIVFVSDHGQLAFGDHFPNTPIDIRKEAFGLADQSIFVEDSIFLPARNGGFLTSPHAIDATFIAAGPLFKNEGVALPVRDMRTIDIYPLLLEALDCKIPDGRKGYIPDILQKESYVNESHRYPAQQERKRVLLLANMPVYEMNAFINQYFLRNRFHDIYIFADQKYKETYEVNPLVVECLTYQKDTTEYCFESVILPTENDKYSLNFKEYKGD